MLQFQILPCWMHVISLHLTLTKNELSFQVQSSDLKTQLSCPHLLRRNPAKSSFLHHLRESLYNTLLCMSSVPLPPVRRRVFKQALRIISSVEAVISEANTSEALITNTYLYCPWSQKTWGMCELPGQLIWRWLYGCFTTIVQYWMIDHYFKNKKSYFS